MEKELKQKFGELGVGDEFELVGLKWKILDITDKGYVCLADKLEERMQFDPIHNNWKDSKLRNYLNSEFLKKLATAIGSTNIISFKRDLLSLDGQKEYGSCEDSVSLLTVDEYRKYREHIPNAGYWWWMCTPDSTECNNDTTWITVVSPSGSLGNYNCGSSIGVPPFCIFSSSLFESEE